MSAKRGQVRIGVPRLDLEYTERARHDLTEISGYTELNWGTDQADAHLAKIRTAIDRLRDFPYKSVRRDDLGRQVRAKFVVHEWIIFQAGARSLWILRVLNEREDINHAFIPFPE